MDKDPPKDFIDSLNEQEAAKKQEQDKQVQIQAINKAGIKNVEATNANTESTAKGLKDVRGKVAVTNPDLAKSSDLQNVTDAIHKMNMTAFITNDGLPKLAEGLSDFTDKVKNLSNQYKDQGFTQLAKQLGTAVKALQDVSAKLSDTKIQVDIPLKKTLDGLQKSISGIDFKPQVNVNAPDTKVITTPVDLTPVTKSLGEVVQTLKNQKVPEPVDLDPVINGLQTVQNAITSLRFPVPNYVLPFQTSTGKDVQLTAVTSTSDTTKTGLVALNPDGSNISGGSGGGGTQYAEGTTTSPATGTVALGRYNTSSPTLTDGQLNAPQLDVSGNLKVNIASGGGSGGTSSSFSATFPSTGTAIGATDGTNMQPLKVDGSDNLLVKVNTALPAGTNAIGSITNTSFAATQSGTWNITNVNGTVSLPTGAATAAKQPALGTAGSASPDVLTVQGIASMVALKVDGSGVTQPVSGTVTANAGTNLNTSALALDTSVNGLLVGQASTTSGQLGPLGQTATTTVAPTYTTAKTNPLSTDTSGNLRTSVNNMVTITGTVTANAGTNLNTSTLALESGGNLATLAATVSSSKVNVNISSGSIANTSFIVTQATGTNLHTVVDSGTITTVSAVTAITNALPAGTNGIGNVGTVSAVVNVGQKTVNTTAVQISASSTIPTNGIIIRNLSTSAASIFVGGSGVTTSNGFELVPGEATSFTCNLNTLYIISAASTTDKICWNVE